MVGGVAVDYVFGLSSQLTPVIHLYIIPASISPWKAF